MRKKLNVNEIIEQGDRFLLTTHMDPDGDAVGSVCSCYWALASMKKHPFIYMQDPIPYMYDFLPKPPSIAHTIPKDRYDAIVVMDCGDLSRIGGQYRRLRDEKNLVNIDHHATNDMFGTVNIVDDKASSTAEILYGLFKSLHVPVAFNIAISIYTAILTDTGSFRHENTNSNAFVICEKMIKYGVKPSYVSRMVYENHPKERFLLLGQVLSTLDTYDHGKLAMAHVTGEMFRKTHTAREHTEGFSEYIREIKDVEVAVLLREINELKYKISMRSKGAIDVANICNRFGGGGHRAAAGCTIDGNIQEVKMKLREALNTP